MEKTNILLIMTDQQRFDSLGCYGFDAIPTPNLDRLADEGTLFENCYVNNPICTPSRASIFTGKHLPGHGVYGLYDLLPEQEVLFPEFLQNNGYETALFGKLHVSGALYERDHRNLHDGFDHYDWNHEPALFETSKYNGYAHWLYKNHPIFYEDYFSKRRDYGPIPEEVHCTNYLCTQAAEFIRTRTSTKPFFCFLSIFDPHNPYNDCPVEGRAMVDVNRLPLPDYRVGETIGKPEGIRLENMHGYMGAFEDFSVEDIREMQIGYYGSIAFLDKQLGKVFNALEETSILENTLIIFVSDHGDMLGDHELLAKGAFFYDPCTKVPLLIRQPGGRGGTRVKKLVQPHDVAATILSAAGSWTDDMKKIFSDSQDLLSDAETQDENVAVCIYRGSGISDQMKPFDPPIHATMFRTRKYKMNLYHCASERGLEGQLFDMETDPKEQIDLWNSQEHQIVKDELFAQYLDWFVRYDLKHNSGHGGVSATVQSSLSKE